MVAEGQCITKQFSAEEFGKVLRSANFIGACAFFRAIERLASPGWHTNFQAHGVLREFAMRVYEDCQGIALSTRGSGVVPVLWTDAKGRASVRRIGKG